MSDEIEEIEEAWVDDGGKPIQDQALDYARYGLRVFPVHSTEKRPLPGYGWKELASSKVNHVVEDFETAVSQWGEENTSVAWAIGQDGYVAIDIDVPRDEWPDWVSDLIDSAAINPTKRGTHLVFKNPDEFVPGNTDTKFPTTGWGEVRGAGGYIVIAGPDRPGLPLDGIEQARKFPRPEWLAPYSGGADAVSWSEVKPFAEKYNTISPSKKLAALRKALDSWDPAHEGHPSKGRHPYLVWATTTAAEEAIQGHYPFAEALKLIQEWWKSVTPPERHGREFKGAVTWAIGRAQATTAPADPDQNVEHQADEDMPSIADGIRPLDWHEFWTADRDEEDWFIEGFWPRGRAMLIHAKAKEGKSEFVLWCIVHLVQGIDPWTGEKIEPRTVCYFDFEMTEDDLLDRLTDMGIAPDADLSRLRYYLLPPLSPLDTQTGAAQIMAIVEQEQPDAIVIDTFGRAVEGEEDSADTVRDFYRLTGVNLKKAGVGYLRTDHTGKDASKGARGSSAKNDDVDIIWSMSRTSTGTKLTSRSRVSWVPEKLEATRRFDGRLRYVKQEQEVELGSNLRAAGRADELDKLGIPRDWGFKKIVAHLHEIGAPVGRTNTLKAAIKLRKSNAEGTPQGVPEADGTPSDDEWDLA